MPLAKRWSTYNKETVREETDNYGVYEIGHKASGQVLYIGEGHVRARLMAHFPDGSHPFVGGDVYRVEYTGGKDRAVQRQNAELAIFMNQNEKKLPKFNWHKRRGL